MTRIVPLSACAGLALSIMGCQAFAQPPAPSVNPKRVESLEETRALLAGIDPIADEATEFEPEARVKTDLDGVLSQGGLVTGKTVPGTKVVLSGKNEAGEEVSYDVGVDDEGNFLLGFDRDHPALAKLTVTYPDGTTESSDLPIEKRTWRESRITVTDPNKANPYKKEDIEKIQSDIGLKIEARETRAQLAHWTEGLEWPAEGCVSSPFGRRRIVNGEPKRFHSGVDVAAPDGVLPMDYHGEPVRAPAPGYVRLAEDDMFFEGGMVFIDHGQHLETALMHLSSVDVAVGDFVEKGQKVGEVGATGRVTGVHLHWSLKWRDRLLDPELAVVEKPVCTD